MIQENELKKIIKLNKEEAFTLTKEYMFVYLSSILKDPTGKNNRRILVDKIKEYYQITREENLLMEFIIKNSAKISSSESLDNLLDRIDILNEHTYKHYDNILKEYEENILLNMPDRKIIPYKSFKTLLETTTYQEELLGLTLTIEDLKEYFKEEIALDYLLKNTKIISVPLEDGMGYYGCYQIMDNELLKSIKICVPHINNLESMKINIHEYKHGLDLFPYLGKIPPTMDYEKKAQQETEKFRETYLTKKKILL